MENKLHTSYEQSGWNNDTEFLDCVELEGDYLFWYDRGLMYLCHDDVELTINDGELYEAIRSTFNFIDDMLHEGNRWSATQYIQEEFPQDLYVKIKQLFEILG